MTKNIYNFFCKAFYEFIFLLILLNKILKNFIANLVPKVEGKCLGLVKFIPDFPLPPDKIFYLKYHR